MTDENAPTFERKAAVRHVEKRRISTCVFADRVATRVLEVYRAAVQPKPHPTCLAAILVHQDTNDELSVIALGVGTKFLMERVLHDEQDNERPYGRRVRDMHGEVLCRRALRHYLSQCILRDIRGESVREPHVDFLERIQHDKWRVRRGFTLHAYFSSTPCGNATVKKFAKLSKEKFRPELNMWPTERHPPERGHSIHLGQFALLVKKDATAVAHVPDHTDTPRDKPPCKHKPIPEENIPAGTALVHSGQGSLHTCSDKVCRWNCLGWQGALLAAVLEEPLQMQSITVGRKFSSICLRRAVCCRIAPDDDHDETNQQRYGNTVYHPSVMCTAVYVDPDAVVVPQPDNHADDLQFTATQAYVWWPTNGLLTSAHAIDSSTGFAANEGDGREESPVCTQRLTGVFRTIQYELGVTMDEPDDGVPETLDDLRRLKLKHSSEYESEKAKLFQHKVMRQWCRRCTFETA